MKYTKIPETTWRKATTNMARRERFRLVSLGRIVPVFRSTPQLLVKDADGRWCPELRFRSGAHPS